MIKKHLIACSAVVLVMIFTKLMLHQRSATRVNSFPQNVDIPSREEETEEPAPKSFISSLSFANEGLPKNDPRVAWRMKYFLKVHNYKNLQTNELHKKAARWFPVIEPILRMQGIPDDFKYIPLVESGFGAGTSHRGASGYWQFMPGTARHYGLRVDGEIDERQNMRRSTLAACRYLKELFGEFKNWTLVAAAYNAGENSIKREMGRQRKSNYFKMRLNKETATYVYKLISMKQIIENPLKYGYAERSRNLLAEKQDPDPSPRPHTFINPAVETRAANALSILVK